MKGRILQLSNCLFCSFLCSLLIAVPLGCSSDGETTDGSDAGETLDGLGGSEVAEDGSSADLSSETSDANNDVERTCQSPVQRLLWSFLSPGPDNIRSLAYVTDADGDKVPDVLFVSEALNIYDKPLEGFLTLVSGASSGTGSVIWTTRPKNDRGYAHTSEMSDRSINQISDLNGDGINDVLFGSSGYSKSAFAVDGYSGETLWYFDTFTEPQPGVIYSIKPFSDVNGDYIPEVIFTASSHDNRGYLADGATGTILWRFLEVNDPMMDAIQINDINNDGYPDAVFGSGQNPNGYSSYNVAAVSGKPNGTNQFATSIWQHSTGGTNWTLAALNDVNQDGKQDVVVGVWYNKIVALSGHNGDELWSQDVDLLTMRIVRLDDVNGDSLDDLAATSSGGGIIVLSGKDGSVWWRGVDTDATWGLDRVEDVDGDGVNDVVSGGADSFVRMYSGKSGTLLWEYDTGDEKVMTVRAVPDTTGDGFPEVAAGTQYLQTGEGGGTVFLLNGCPQAD